MIISNAMVCTATDHGDKEGAQDQEDEERRSMERGQKRCSEQQRQEVEELQGKQRFLSCANESELLPTCLSHLRVSAI
jgi:hypothetical protein